MAKQMEQSNRIPIAVANALAIETAKLEQKRHEGVPAIDGPTDDAAALLEVPAAGEVSCVPA
jgi:hypothetical protein